MLTLSPHSSDAGGRLAVTVGKGVEGSERGVGIVAIDGIQRVVRVDFIDRIEGIVGVETIDRICGIPGIDAVDGVEGVVGVHRIDWVKGIVRAQLVDRVEDVVVPLVLLVEAEFGPRRRDHEKHRPNEQKEDRPHDGPPR